MIDFLLVLIEAFRLCVIYALYTIDIDIIELFSLGRTAEALRANIGSKSAISLQRGPVDQKFQV